MRKQAFTLVELLIAITCFTIILGPLYMLMRSGTQTSMRGVKSIETTMEARRVMKQIYADLKMLCFVLPDDMGVDTVFSFDSAMKVEGIVPKKTYSFQCFPANQEYDNIFEGRCGKSISFRHVSNIKYSVIENSSKDNPFMKLVRTEVFKGEIKKQILSEHVNFFEIKPIFISQPGTGKNQYYYLVTLQLADILKKNSENLGKVGTGEKIEAGKIDKDIILADFFDVVYPEYFHAAWNQSNFGLNWHTMLKDSNQ